MASGLGTLLSVVAVRTVLFLTVNLAFVLGSIQGSIGLAHLDLDLLLRLLVNVLAPLAQDPDQYQSADILPWDFEHEQRVVRMPVLTYG